MIKLKVKRLNDSVMLPTYGSKGAGAIDFYAHKNQIIKPKTTELIKLGLAVEVPDGHALVLMPRSSIGLKTPLRMSNSVGLIDSDYRGEIGAIYDNICDSPIAIYKGDRVVQGLIIPIPKIELIEVDELSETERGTGGYGSTGK